MKSLIIGHGDIGQALEKLIFQNLTAKAEIHDPDKGFTLTPKWIKDHPIDIVHICFPFHHSSNFLKSILNYLIDFKPKYCIIHSTVLIDTCDQIQDLVCHIPIIHIPIRGTHTDLISGMEYFPIFIGSNYDVFEDNDLLEYISALFPVKKQIVNSPKETALGKLLSVVWYGMNIAFAQEAMEICKKHKVNFSQAYTEYFKTDNIGLNYDQNNEAIECNYVMPRPTFFPGYIGGKCVIQDVMLLKPFGITFELYDFILKSNRRFKPLPKCPRCSTKTLKRSKIGFGLYCPFCKVNIGMVELDQSRIPDKKNFNEREQIAKDKFYKNEGSS